MSGTSSKPRSWYKTDTARPKKQNKYSEVLKQKKRLETRLKSEGATKWLKNAMDVLAKRLDRMRLK